MTKPDKSNNERLMMKFWSPEIADDPEAYVMFAYPWGMKGTPLEHFTGPREWQRRILRAIKHHIQTQKFHKQFSLPLSVFNSARVSGRGIGKSAVVSWITDWMRTCRVGSSQIVSANTEAQLRTITWAEMSKWVAMSVHAHWWDVSSTKIAPQKWLADIVERDMKKGTRYWATEGKLWSEENPDAYAGPHNFDGMMVIFDEASGIPDPIWSVAEGYFTEPVIDRYWCCFGNGRRNQGKFYECFHADREFWSTEDIDARSVEGIDPGVYQKIIDKYGVDSDEARVEVYGQFPKSGEDQFIALHVIKEAQQRARWNDPSAPIVVGVDPARFGSDSTVIAIRKGRDLMPLRYFKGDDTMTVVGHVIGVIREHQPNLVVIDEGGLGAGILDRLKEQGYAVRGVNFGSKPKNGRMYRNRRAELWGSVREWVGHASIPDDRRLQDDLVMIRKKPDSQGRILLLDKTEMRKLGFPSPDAGDALACTFAYRVVTDSDEIDTRKALTYSNSPSVTHWMGA